MNNLYHNNTYFRRTTFFLLLLTFIAGLSGLATASSPATTDKPNTIERQTALDCSFQLDVAGLKIRATASVGTDFQYALISYGDGSPIDSVFNNTRNQSVIESRYTYNSPGDYEICLFIISGGASCNQCQQVSVNSDNETECDASFAYQVSADSLTFDFYAEQPAQEYIWSVDREIIAFDSAFSYQFEPGDSAIVSLEVHNFGENCSTSQQITTAGRAKCDASFAYHVGADSLTFDFYAEHSAQEYIWLVDGEIIAFDSAFSYQFEPGDSAIVSLEVHNFGKNCSTSQEVFIRKISTCDASFIYEVSPSDSLTYIFTANSEARLYQWTIGGEHISFESPLTYRFDEFGTYEVSLSIITPDRSESCSASVTMDINGVPFCDASFDYVTDSDSLRYEFYAKQSAEEYQWTIDGELFSVDSVFVYQFAPGKKYTVALRTIQGDETCIAEQEIMGGSDGICNAKFNYLQDSISNTARFYFYASAQNLSYRWTINNQSVVSVESAFLYTFPEDGRYTVTLSTENFLGQSCQFSRVIHVNTTDSCSAAFTYYVEDNEPLNYTFVSGSEASSYQWAVDNQVLAQDSVFTYTFPGPGSYEVIHRVERADSLRCYSSRTITIDSTNCNAAFVYHIDPRDSLSLTFIPEQTRVNFSYEWKIDGQLASSDSAFVYRFPGNGSYVVSLTVFDEDQNSCSSEQLIHVLKNNDNTYSIKGSLFADVLPVDGGTVDIYRQSDGSWTKVSESRTQNGNFVTEGLPEGRYLLYARGNEQIHSAFIPTYFVNGISWSDAYHLDLTDSIEEIKITLIRSEILSGGGSGLLRGRLSELTNDRPSVVLLKDQVSKKVLRWTMTDGNSEFSFDDLPLGSYQLTAEIPGESFSRSVTLTESRSVVMDFEMSPGVVSSVDDFDVLGHIAIYPTRFSDHITLQNSGQNQEELSVEIMTMAGKVIFKEAVQIPALSTRALYPASGSQGLLIIKIQNEKGEITTSRLIRE